MNSLHALEVHERPRERLQSRGAVGLSDVELVAVILGSGTKAKGVLAISELVLERIDRDGAALCVEGLCEIGGIGTAKATAVVAAMELARRRIRPFGTKIKRPDDVFALVRHLADRKQEVFAALTLNGAHEVIATRVITVGLLDRTQVHPREVFADAIADRAAAIIVAHNHPSGDLEPSDEDIQVTRRLIDAGKLLGIQLLDHLVFCGSGFTSMADLGLV